MISTDVSKDSLNQSSHPYNEKLTGLKYFERSINADNRSFKKVINILSTHSYIVIIFSGGVVAY
jgi:hypothetical protein